MIRALAVVGLLASVARADELAAYVAAAPRCEAMTCIALALHVAHVGETPVADPAFVAAQVAAANQQFAVLAVGFQVVAADAASVPRVDDGKARRALGKTVPADGAIHLFLTGALADVDRAGAHIRGVTLRAKVGKFVILSNIAMERVLAHELGHVFGLPHSTFPISIMNKTPRVTPPIEDRVFAPAEVTALTATAARLVRAKVLVPR